jgi:hypothetical protein
LPKGGPILWSYPNCQHYCHRKGFSDADHIAALLAKEEGILTPAISYPPENRNKLCLIFNITIQSDFFDWSQQSECGRWIRVVQ